MIEEAFCCVYGWGRGRMLDNQWFAVEAGQRGLIREAGSVPALRKKTVVTTASGTITVLHGPGVLTEEDEATFALAVGDTRGLRRLAEYRDGGPKQHAVVCVIDKRTLTVRVITDRINFAKIFYCEDGDGFALSTHLSFFSREKLKLSMSGVASTIANGAQFNNQTVYSNISVLDRATVHEFGGAARKATTYWRYEFDTTGNGQHAERQLKEVLVEAVRAQVCERPVLLSLSGGYDSSGILGVLARYVKPASLRTFSYVLGTPAEGCDALVARAMAERTGYPHEMIEAYDGDVVRTIVRNARLGQGLSNFCDEMDAWHRQGEKLAGAVMLAGDECFGWTDRRLTSTDDVLVSVCLRKFESAAVLEPYVGAQAYRAMADELAARVDQVLTRTTLTQLHDLKDFLYLDQRTPWGLLPWRRFLIGSFFEVREPFLQTEVLDVVKTMTRAQRVGKALYRKVIQELAPEVFTVPRARTGQAMAPWRAELVKHRRQVERLLEAPSALDAVIGPDALRALLNSLATQNDAKPNWKMTARRMVGPTATRLLRSFVRPEAPKTQPAETILMRLLTLRCFLADETTLDA